MHPRGLGIGRRDIVPLGNLGESLPWITHDTDTIYVSSREKDAAIGTLSDWLDQLMKDILSNNTNMGFENCVSYRLLSNLHQFKGVNISPLDYERLIALVYFLHSKKCSNAKLRSIKQCVDQISDYILDADSRLEMIRLACRELCGVALSPAISPN